MSLALAEFGYYTCGIITLLSVFCLGWIASTVYTALTSRRKRDSRGRFIKQH